MTWSLQHTIPYTSDADFDSMWTYLADTAMPAKGWTVTAGDDSFSRFVQIDVNNGWGSAGSQTLGWFMDWQSATNDDVTFMWDHVRDGNTAHLTTTYQKIGTSHTSGDCKFWYSDQSDGILVTFGREIMFYWPGSAASNFEYWSYGTTQAPTSGISIVYPWIGTQWSSQGAPGSGTSNSSGYVGSLIAQSSGSQPAAGRLALKTDSPILGSGTTSYGYGPLFKIPFNDVSIVYPSVSGVIQYYFLWQANAGIATDGTNFYIASGPSSSGYNALWFNCGTSEPNF